MSQQQEISPTGKLSTSTAIEFATACLQKAGARADIAEQMAKSLVYGDLFGFRTHGLRRLPYNVKQLQSGQSQGQGDVDVVQERLATAHWDAHGLSGLYVIPQAVEHAISKARDCGTATVVVRRCDHVASLAAYLHLATEQGMVISMLASTPAQASVAPFGAKSRVFSPNPFGFAVPYSPQGEANSPQRSIMFDMSFSVTAAGKVRQAYDRQESLPWPAIIAPDGSATANPASYLDEGGALLPLGGIDLGFKGYGLCLMSELLTMGLTGYGRDVGADDGEFNSVYIQVSDPTAFTSTAEFDRVVADLAQRCLQAEPINAEQPPRLPGERAWREFDRQMNQGVELDELTWPRLCHVARKLGVAIPASTAERS